jgi:hypothetical protein
MAEIAGPQYVGPTFSSLQAMLTAPIMLTGLFRDIFVKHFQEWQNTEPALRSLVWRPGADTDILVESIHRWDPTTTGNRPAVLIKRQTYRNHRAGINDQGQGNPIDREGNRRFETFWNGSHTLFCLGSEGAQVEVLSTEVQRELTQFGPAIRESLSLMRFQVFEVGAIAELKEAERTFVVPVTVAYSFTERWTLSQDAPRLKRVSLSSITQC